MSSINIRPGVGILGLFPAMNYKAWYALAELVDNALDSYITRKPELRRLEGPAFRLRIVIDVEGGDGGFIRVWDNAGGIDTTNYERAFVTAEPPTTSVAGLSQFGIGMKSASCWFAREWSVRTSALGEPIERFIEFDVPKIIEYQIDHLEATITDAPEKKHGTEVRLWNLHKPPQTQTIGKMRRHLASMYRQFLRDGDVVIEFNGVPLSFGDAEILVAPHYKDPGGTPRAWRKELSFRLSTGERVSGFVAIRKKGSTKEAGLSLYRHRRLIVGSDDDSYRPPEIFGGANSYSRQRVFGELDLDDFDVTHTKDGFRWEDKQEELLETLRQQMDAPPLPIISQAEGYRAREAGPDLAAAAARAANKTAAVIPHAQPVIESQATDRPEEAPPAEEYDGEAISSTRSFILVIKHEEWHVTIDTTTDPAATEWVKIREHKRDGKKRELGILFSVSHPFTQRFGGSTAEDLEGLLRVAVGVAVAETTAREAGVRLAGVLARNLNELLGGVLARE
jgi:hypothetical protein